MRAWFCLLLLTACVTTEAPVLYKSPCGPTLVTYDDDTAGFDAATCTARDTFTSVSGFNVGTCFERATVHVELATNSHGDFIDPWGVLVHGVSLGWTIVVGNPADESNGWYGSGLMHELAHVCEFPMENPNHVGWEKEIKPAIVAAGGRP